MAGRRTVNSLMLVRPQPPERNSSPRRLTDRPSGYEPDSPSSNLGGGTRRSVAQRQSGGPTNRGAQVRVLPDRRWLWCKGSMGGGDPPGPGSIPASTPRVGGAAATALG